MRPRVDDALDIHRRGFSIFPLQPGSKQPLAHALSPACKLLINPAGGLMRDPNARKDADGFDRGGGSWLLYQSLRVSEVEVQDWWTRFPSANLAVATGAVSGCFVLDIDEPQGLEIIEMNGGLPDTLRVHTSVDSSGFQKTHYYFRFVAGIRNSGRIFPGADIRGNGGYVMAPPSIHPSGAQYCFVDPDAEIAEAPAWLIAMASKPEEPKKPVPAPIPVAASDADYYRKWCLQALRGECEKINNAGQGSRHHQRLKSSKAIGGLIHCGGISYEEALDAMAANPSRDADNARAAAVSGLQAGMAAPRDIPPPTQRAERVDPWENIGDEPFSGSGSGGRLGLESGLGDEAEAAPENLGPLMPEEGDSQYAPTWAESAPDDRPIIEVHDRQLSTKLQAISEAVEARNQPEPSIYKLVQGIGAIRRDINGELSLVAANPVDAQNLFTKAARFVSTKMVKGNLYSTQVNPPKDLAECWLQSEDHGPGIPPLDSIATAPFVAADGTICTRPGYHREARKFLYLPPGFEMPDTEPTEANVAWAKELIQTQLLDQFPFADDASKAHALAQSFLFLVRDLIKGPTPMHLWDAPTQSSGKSYGAETFMAAFTEPVLSAEKRDEPEWGKWLTGALVSGSSHIFIDNIKGGLNSASLAMAITAPIFSDRMLGGNTLVRVPVKVIWIGTSNNAQLGKDPATRVVVIRLDTGLENPENREFKFDPKRWVQTHRGEVIAAFMVLVRQWLDAGRPGYSGKTHSRFGAWQSVIGGILELANYPEFLGNLQQYGKALDPEGQAWNLFVQNWWQEFQSQNVVTTQLLELANEQVEISARLGDKGEKSQIIRLGKLLAGARDKVYSGCKIGLGEIDRRRTTTYALTQVNVSDDEFEDEYGGFGIEEEVGR